jgi:hypothetical protein
LAVHCTVISFPLKANARGEASSIAVKLVPVMQEAIAAVSRENRVDCRWGFAKIIRGR